MKRWPGPWRQSTGKSLPGQGAGNRERRHALGWVRGRVSSRSQRNQMSIGHRPWCACLRLPNVYSHPGSNAGTVSAWWSASKLLYG